MAKLVSRARATRPSLRVGIFRWRVLTTDLDGDGTNDNAQENGFVEGQLITSRVERCGSTLSFFTSELRVHTYGTEVAVSLLFFSTAPYYFPVYDWRHHKFIYA